ncbi:formate--tetrahydrofolate ligase, partial [Raoultella terrigena]|uniref:formate--tetrahydrofolate ligase n=1 Tax=Raoultella terrigena TaxID=577 RepID=UPI00216A2619
MSQAQLKPDMAVLVATIRALKMHGGVDLTDLKTENVAAVTHGFANLERHAQNLRKFGLPVVVAINRFATDTDAEIATLRDLCEQDHLPVALADVWGKGGAGTEDLARLVTDTLAQESADFHPLYPDSASLKG